MLLILPTFCTANSSIIVSAIEERRCGIQQGHHHTGEARLITRQNNKICMHLPSTISSMPSLKTVRVGRSSPKLTHKSNDETNKSAVSKRTGKRKIISDPAKGNVEDDDDEHVQPAKKKRAKKSPKKTEKRNVKEDTDVVEEFSCPHCDKKFKSQPGCKYHVGEFLTYSIHSTLSKCHLYFLTYISMYMLLLSIIVN